MHTLRLPTETVSPRLPAQLVLGAQVCRESGDWPLQCDGSTGMLGPVTVHMHRHLGLDQSKEEKIKKLNFIPVVEIFLMNGSQRLTFLVLMFNILKAFLEGGAEGLALYLMV